MKDNDTLLTGHIIVDWLMLMTLGLPGIVAYLIADNLWGDKWFGTFPVVVGVIVVLIALPLSNGISNLIRRWGRD